MRTSARGLWRRAGGRPCWAAAGPRSRARPISLTRGRAGARPSSGSGWCEPVGVDSDQRSGARQHGARQSRLPRPPAAASPVHRLVAGSLSAHTHTVWRLPPGVDDGCVPRLGRPCPQGHTPPPFPLSSKCGPQLRDGRHDRYGFAILPILTGLASGLAPFPRDPSRRRDGKLPSTVPASCWALRAAGPIENIPQDATVRASPSPLTERRCGTRNAGTAGTRRSIARFCQRF